MSDIEREEFEQAVTDRWSDSYKFTRFGDEDYYDEVLEGMWWGWQASREALEGEAIGYVVPRMLEAMLAGKYCGISMSAEPKEDGIAVYTHPASDDATECPYPCGWSDLQSIAIRKAAFIARSAEDDIGTPFEDIRQAGSELGRIAIKLCSLAIKQEQKS